MDNFNKEKNAESYALVLKKTQELNLPQLVGSEKQIPWANTIRIELIEAIENSIEETDNDQIKNNVRDFLEHHIKPEKSASWFINTGRAIKKYF